METHTYDELRRHLFEHSCAAHIFRDALRKNYRLNGANSFEQVIKWCQPYQLQFRKRMEQELAQETQLVPTTPLELDWRRDIENAKLPHGFLDIAKAAIPEITQLAEALRFHEDFIVGVIAKDYVEWAAEKPHPGNVITLRRLFPERGAGRITSAGTYIRVDDWTRPDELKSYLEEMRQDITDNNRIKHNAFLINKRPEVPSITRIRNKTVTPSDTLLLPLFKKVEKILIMESRLHRKKQGNPGKLPPMVMMAIGTVADEAAASKVWRKRLGLTQPVSVNTDITDIASTKLKSIYFDYFDRYRIPTFQEANSLLQKIVLQKK